MAAPPECGQRRAAWVLTGLGLALEVLVLAAVWGSWLLWGVAPQLGQRDFGSPVGWLAAFGAALIFGFTEVPVKVPESQAMGPTLFNAYGFISNGAVHVAIALSLRRLSGEPMGWQWSGAMAAIDIMVVQILARNAVWLLGIAIGPPCWCAIGMSTSFAWGTLAFGDEPGSLWPSLLGLLLLVLGVSLVGQASALSRASQKGERCATSEPEPSSAQVVGSPSTGEAFAAPLEGASLKAARQELPERPVWSSPSISRSSSPSSPEPAGGPRWRASPLGAQTAGFAYALGAGLADGSLTAFYQRMEGSMLRQGAEGAPVAAAAALASYFGSFGVSMLVAGSAACGCALVARPSAACASAAGLPPAMASGAMWAGANSCSVLASHLLGMALSFPLTQTAVVICGLLGMLVFHELAGRPARAAFCLALAVIAAGAGLLSAFGRPSEP